MAEAVAANVPATTGADEPKKPLFGLTFLENLSEMSMLRQIVLLVGLAASVAIGFAVVLWSQQPDYKPLLGSLAGMDSNQVMEVLNAADIAYTVEPNSGALLVKSEDLGRARLRLAAAGVAPSDNNVGFEILDKEQSLGTSQFMEATRYRRGLEGELARTISSLNNVKGARVHLAIPKSSVFVRDERKPTASVLVELYPGRSLEPSQVMAIVNLVATSVPELTKSQVTVVDQKGNLLSDQQELSELTMAGKQFDYTRRMETLFTQRVHNILQPVLGNGRYKAEVSADVDFSAVESTSESFNPDQPALRSEQQVNEQRTSSLPPQGVPGALSNQPPGAASAPEQATGQAAPAGPIAAGQPLVDANGQQITDPATGQPMLAPYPADKREQSTRNFELDRSISYTKQQQGRLKRLSVAVVLDDKITVAANGEVTRSPWGAEDLARFTRLVQDSVGFDASRGDSVSVINAPFSSELGEVVELPWYQSELFLMAMSGLKQLLPALLIFTLVWFVLRPVMKNIANPSRQGEDAEGDVELGDMGGLEGELSSDRVSLGGPQSILLPSPSEGYDAQLNAIKSLVAEDPGRVAQVVKDWINADE
ncbi:MULTISPECIES: flagellar basal-body MS-ring/collar protein FliF [unclassified Pseudomonas]|uniref:flagellar basal-body MS-ring/collar protein FliF n=1 Tax=unclassified Pseudomonas TaxID=196821 RepID=UPI00244BDAA9|nr:MULTISPECIES: flagellar basal-body MS-ring/collar protein FliF [unclassified Pseudomonas]MDG9927130.1 flagellar basal-body MS-ring/collar protein FliF [Pseudomonas sp. GD04042]MDH0482861.1 flagellar basal-body MS-ring/collar protein FliF [Pseudomonas sp. GD04015]MDH0602545.1 flagellar basal-body MS-ring/collar protein FliF [Pseudomonas sp. GD03869]